MLRKEESFRFLQHFLTTTPESVIKPINPFDLLGNLFKRFHNFLLSRCGVIELFKYDSEVRIYHDNFVAEDHVFDVRNVTPFFRGGYFFRAASQALSYLMMTSASVASFL